MLWTSELLHICTVYWAVGIGTCVFLFTVILQIWCKLQRLPGVSLNFGRSTGAWSSADGRMDGWTVRVAWRIGFWLICRWIVAYFVICRLSVAYLSLICSSFVRYVLLIHLSKTEVCVILGEALAVLGEAASHNLSTKPKLQFVVWQPCSMGWGGQGIWTRIKTNGSLAISTRPR